MMWDQIFKRWVDLLFWWAPRGDTEPPARPDRPVPPASARSAEPAPVAPAAGVEPAPRAEPEPPARSVEPEPKAPPAKIADDLTVIKGIGPAVQEKLRSLGIATFGDLARADPLDLTEKLKASQPISEARVRGWTDAARERAQA